MTREMLAVLLLLAWATLAEADTTHCTTRYDAAFKRYRTECRDGSLAVTRYDAAFKRGNTDITTPGKASQKGK